jgi:hypothetical protein
MHGLGVEVSEFSVFLVVFPARRISSVSPRFYFRKHTFCFFPLVIILESPRNVIISSFISSITHSSLSNVLFRF